MSRLSRIKRGWDTDEGGWKTLVILLALAGFIFWVWQS